jgi:hypothetical protein
MEFDPNSAVLGAELFARYILYSSHVRADASIKPDAFIPDFDRVRARMELSVTRHDSLNENEIWARGHQVAAANAKDLHGRADVSAAQYSDGPLSISPDPEPNNPQHVVVINWPEDKPFQKALAQEISENCIPRTEHVISCEEAVNYIDRVVIATGKVGEVRRDAKQNVILRFESSPVFVVRISRDVMATAGGRFSDLEGKAITVTGKVLSPGGFPGITVTLEAQITVS